MARHLDGLDIQETRRPPSRLESALWIHAAWSGSRAWEWRLAWVLETLHQPLVCTLLTAYFWLSWVYPTMAIAAVMIWEAAVKGCPLTGLTARLRRRVDPDLPPRTLWLEGLYERHGRSRVLLTSLGGLAVVTAVAALVQHVV
ncbi:hypothetical protein DSM104299_00421 [Baekduia alba]|uniref:hypothetical protein n=1 Tax=Baekduia alba TaxID=2997333 RepID=UPI0023408705|nr:hypothetical protein [Baekduia alba]WCB91745.1 hypothetical protein DSM104299_00421 [Baekduia alba]